LNPSESKILSYSTLIWLPRLLKISQYEPSLIKSYRKKYQNDLFKTNFNLVKNPNFHKIYLINYDDSKSENFSTYNSLCFLGILKILEFKTSPKFVYSENKKMTHLRLVSRLITNPNIDRRYLRNYNEPESEIFTRHNFYISSFSSKFYCMNHSINKRYRKNTKMTRLNQ
jgi:hypothetical protein